MDDGIDDYVPSLQIVQHPRWTSLPPKRPRASTVSALLQHTDGGAADGGRGDERWRTTGHLLADAAGRWGERNAIVDVDRTLTYAQLAADAETVSSALLRRGVETGDAVAIWAPNSWRWVVFALGAQMAGAAIVPLNTRYRAREASHIVGTTRPKSPFRPPGLPRQRLPGHAPLRRHRRRNGADHRDRGNRSGVPLG